MPKAILCNSNEGLSSLRLEMISSPQVKADEVRIAVRYAGVNFPDTLIIQGKYQFQPEYPFSPGQEVSGEVLEVGNDVTHVKEGDFVLASMTWGGYAEETVAHKDNTYLLPPVVSFEQGAALLETYGTAIHALKDRGSLTAGETLVVLGASGGTGSAAVQLGKVMGAKVVAVCSTAAKREAVLSNGADAAIGYDDLKNQLKQFKVDVIFDPVGGDASEQAFRALRPNGRHLVVGFASGKIPTIPFNLPLLKSASVVGVFWGSFWRTNPLANRSNINMVLKWLAQKEIDVVISQTMDLKEAKHALELLMTREAIGKTVLKVR